MTLNNKLHQVRSEYLSRTTRGDGRLLQLVEQYVGSHTGKMLRPLMLLAAAETLATPSSPLPHRTLLLAVAVEMLHNASLLHDDVIDHAESRRGHPSVNARWGNAAAVLVGDYLLAGIMQLLDEVDDSDAARRINDTVTAMVESELLVLDRGSLGALTADEYLSVIDGKTACLFATAAARSPGVNSCLVQPNRKATAKRTVQSHC